MKVIINKKVYEQWFDTDYYCDENGNVYHKWNKGMKKLTPYRKSTGKSAGKYIVHICQNYKRKEVAVSKMVWESFYGEVPKGYSVVHINGAKSMNDLYNLILMSNEDIGHTTGGKTGKAKWVIDHDTGKIYKGCRSAAKALYCSKQTICDICNGLRKKPIVNVSWYER